MMKSLLILALLVGLTLARPQNSDDNNLVVATTAAPIAPTTAAPNTPTAAAPITPTTAAPITPTTAASNTRTTASPQYLACLQTCPSTQEYNPICGSDSINYHNNGRLTCAQRCGKNVAAVRGGTCQPL